METEYTVLWVDDEWKDLEGFPFQVLNEKINLVAFTNAEEGLAELQKHSHKYDAVLLDGLFYNKADEKGDATSQVALINFVSELEKLSPEQFLPWFILTGKEEIKSGSDFLEARGRREDIFDKLDLERLPELFQKIKNAAGQRTDTQLKEQHAKAFEICREECLGETYRKELLEIIKELGSQNYHLNKLRNIYEALFKRLAELNLIPGEMMEDQGWINGSARFIAGRHPVYELSPKGRLFFHPLIGHHLLYSLAVMQDASHDDGNLSVNKFVTDPKRKSTYTCQSIFYSFMEVLAYFAGLMKKNPEKEKNTDLWTEKNTILRDLSGTVKQDPNNNFYLADCVFSYMEAKTLDLKNKMVKITKVTNNTNEKTSQYPYFVLNFEVLDNVTVGSEK